MTTNEGTFKSQMVTRETASRAKPFEANWAAYPALKLPRIVSEFLPWNPNLPNTIEEEQRKLFTAINNREAALSHYTKEASGL